ncbi:hypothetical protein ACFE04_010732 [Oxalis oulophora]
MNTRLLFSSQKPIVLPTPWPQQPKTLILNPKTSWKLQANNPKGFGTTSKSTPPPLATTTNPTGGNEDDDEIPNEVIYRMIVRILVSVGVPMGMGLLSLHYFGVLKEQHVWDIPVWLPLSTTFLCFAASACGIAYGALSTNLDPEKPGSVFGIDEVKYNWVEMWKEENQ